MISHAVRCWKAHSEFLRMSKRGDFTALGLLFLCEIDCTFSLSAGNSAALKANGREGLRDIEFIGLPAILTQVEQKYIFPLRTLRRTRFAGFGPEKENISFSFSAFSRSFFRALNQSSSRVSLLPFFCRGSVHDTTSEPLKDIFLGLRNLVFLSRGPRQRGRKTMTKCRCVSQISLVVPRRVCSPEKNGLVLGLAAAIRALIYNCTSIH